MLLGVVAQSLKPVKLLDAQKLTYSNPAVTGVACVLKRFGMKMSAEHGNFKVSLVMAKSPLTVKLISTDLTQLSLSPTEKFAFVTY